MTGFNMPPGCNPSDIPGNRPDEKLASEEKLDNLQIKLGKALELIVPFANAFNRLRSYSESDPPDQAHLYANENPTFELLNGEYGRPLTVQDLREISNFIKEIEEGETQKFVDRKVDKSSSIEEKLDQLQIKLNKVISIIEPLDD